MKLRKTRSFANGKVHLLSTEDGYPIETTDTFLPWYTKEAIGSKQNSLRSPSLGSRAERWMIGVSVMSGCPVRCKFCATGRLKRSRNLTAQEIVDQVDFILSEHPELDPAESGEFKINYTRMGEPFLNIEAVREAIERLSERFPNTHHYISTIGIEGADYSWIEGNKTLQLSLHSLDNDRRNSLIPFRRKVSIDQLGEIRTASKLKVTVNLTLVDGSDFHIGRLKATFSPSHFFIKLSPINPNAVSEQNNMGRGIIEQTNLL